MHTKSPPSRNAKKKPSKKTKKQLAAEAAQEMAELPPCYCSEPMQKVKPYTVDKTLAEHMQHWIEKNSRPKRCACEPRRIVRREPTRWSKRGPMTRKDWVRFYNWAATNAAPKPVHQPPSTKQSTKPKKERDDRDLEDLLNKLSLLARPRHPRSKHEYPMPPDYPYSPKIYYHRPAHKDKGRPFDPPEVPEVFQHIDLEAEFWATLRFPLRPSTLKYSPSENILRMAQPRITPPDPPHCPIPAKPVEYIPPRRRMTRLQWQEHLRRIEYLSKPIYRPIVSIFYN